MKITAVTCVKNEGPFLLDWIAYNRVIGVTDFCFFHNDCTDGTNLLLDRLMTLGVVRSYPNPAKSHKFHISALMAAKKKAEVRNADWVAVIDVDEFINIHVGHGKLSDLFSAMGETHFVSICWALFGNNDVAAFEDRPVYEQFTHRNIEAGWSGGEAIDVKTLTNNNNGLNIGRYGVHRTYLRGENLDPVIWRDGSGKHVPRDFLEGHYGIRCSLSSAGRHDLATINHYVLKSVDSFLIQMQRGDAHNPGRVRDYAYWEKFNHNDVEDRRILKLHDQVAAEKDRLMSDPLVACLHAQSVANHKERIEHLRQTPEIRAFLARL